MNYEDMSEEERQEYGFVKCDKCPFPTQEEIDQAYFVMAINEEYDNYIVHPV